MVLPAMVIGFALAAIVLLDTFVLVTVWIGYRLVIIGAMIYCMFKK
jgi:hypothetical protein